jgi:hypothetical protein
MRASGSAKSAAPVRARGAAQLRAVASAQPAALHGTAASWVTARSECRLGQGVQLATELRERPARAARAREPVQPQREEGPGGAAGNEDAGRDGARAEDDHDRRRRRDGDDQTATRTPPQRARRSRRTAPWRRVPWAVAG